MYKPGDYVFHERSGLVKLIKYQGKGMYADAWLTNWGYVWKEGTRHATTVEIAESENQQVVVQILN